MKSLISIVLLLFSVVCFSQCPDAKSNEYKSKHQQYGDHSYATLAAYYYYKCQCDNGIGGRTPEQVNQLVDQYNHLKEHSKNQTGIAIEGRHKVQWITISKVSKCSSASASNGTIGNSDSGIEKPQKKNFFEKIDEELNKVGIDDNVIKSMTEENWDDAADGIKKNMLMRDFQNLGLDSGLSSGLSNLIVGASRANAERKEAELEMLRKKAKEEKRIFDSINLVNEENYIKNYYLAKKEYKSAEPFELKPNLSDFIINDNSWMKTNLINDNMFELTYKTPLKLSNAKHNKDYYKLLSYDNKKINYLENYKISFSVGYYISNKNQIKAKRKSAPLLLYFSESKSIDLGINVFSAPYSTDNIYLIHKNGKKILMKGDSSPGNLSPLDMTNPYNIINTLYQGSVYQNTTQYNIHRNRFNSYLSNHIGSWVYIDYEIVKKDLQFTLRRYTVNDSGSLNESYFESEISNNSFGLKDNRIFIGPQINYHCKECKKGYSVRIRDFTITSLN